MAKNKSESLWREYGEAGNLCRSYEQLSRTSLTIFVPFATAVIAFVLRGPLEDVANILLSLLGFVLSVFTWTMLYRVREFYHVSKTRAVEIERRLGVDLYRRLDQRFKDHRITPTNKIATMWITAIFTFSFVALLIWELCSYYSK